MWYSHEEWKLIVYLYHGLQKKHKTFPEAGSALGSRQMSKKPFSTIILLVVVYLVSWVSSLQISAEERNWLFLSRLSKKKLTSPFNFQAWDSSESTGVYLASRRGTSTVLSIAGQDLGTLVDQCISYSLHWTTQDSTICCTERAKRWTAVKWLLRTAKAQHYFHKGNLNNYCLWKPLFFPLKTCRKNIIYSCWNLKKLIYSLLLHKILNSLSPMYLKYTYDNSKYGVL